LFAIRERGEVTSQRVFSTSARLLVGLVVSLALAFLPVQAKSSQDEQWPIPNNPNFGHHSVVIEDSVDHFSLFSWVENYELRPGKVVFCPEPGKGDCAQGTNYAVNANLAICELEQDSDCIERLVFEKDGLLHEAMFERYVYTSHPNKFVGDGKVFSKNVGSPSIWRVRSMPHEGGDLYLVISGVKGGWHFDNGGSRDVELYAQIVPVSIHSEKAGGQFSFQHCPVEVGDDGLSYVTGCGGPATDYGRYRCSLFEQDGTCLLRQAHDLDASITMDIRLRSSVVGWFHGRMKDPVISATTKDRSQRISISAKPVRVPSFYFGGNYADLPKVAKDYWDECLPAGTCSAGTRQANSKPAEESDGNKRNVIAFESPIGSRAMNILNTFRPLVNDRSVASPTTWSFRTLSSESSRTLDGCSQQTQGLFGLVTTNATSYLEGPPEFNGGYLNYKVAGMHFMANGTDPFLGTYDLLIRADVARCIYGYSNAPISATVAVIGEQGEEKVATTIVSEKDGWLKLAAYGFTFSENEIRAQIRQSQIKTLTNFTSSYLSAKQKAEIRAVLAKSDGNTKFICTGIRYFNQPLSENIKVRARAKAACDYAKSINPNFSYWYQTKTTQARSYNGKVMVVSKG
jgi:hypothetical protein